LEEQEQLFKSNNGNPYYSIEQIAKMEKLDSLLREALRVHTDIGRFYISIQIQIFQVKNNNIFSFCKLDCLIK